MWKNIGSKSNDTVEVIDYYLKYLLFLVFIQYQKIISMLIIVNYKIWILIKVLNIILEWVPELYLKSQLSTYLFIEFN